MIVHELERDKFVHAFFFGAGICPFDLLFAERHADTTHFVLLGSRDQQVAPAAAKVSQTHALFKAEFFQHVINLLLLGTLERVSRLAVVGAGIEHALIEPHFVKIIADVVVVCDVAFLLFLFVAVQAW